MNLLIASFFVHFFIGQEISHARELPQHEITADSSDFALRDSLLDMDYESFKSHLSNGADPTAWLDDSQFGWVMCAATESGREEYLKLLIESGNDVNFRQTDISSAISLPLTCAVRFGNLNALKLLVDAGAQPERTPCDACVNRKPMSVMSEAILVRKYELADWLFNKGNYTDAQLRTDASILQRQKVNESSAQNIHRLTLAEKLRESGYEVRLWSRGEESD
ncbi:ankyrin repeat domain-containing protein [Granulosicoccus sp. 3-233]|uniref:ankyrin repeat domain-containing protein n=1 Tax=Granulosicoccus sp. 3-233 TaxID=3417969 RepID=UPI003D34F025